MRQENVTQLQQCTLVISSIRYSFLIFQKRGCDATECSPSSFHPFFQATEVFLKVCFQTLKCNIPQSLRHYFVFWKHLVITVCRESIFYIKLVNAQFKKRQRV